MISNKNSVVTFVESLVILPINVLIKIKNQIIKITTKTKNNFNKIILVILLLVIHVNNKVIFLQIVQINKKIDKFL